jgi:hypothetical protein
MTFKLFWHCLTDSDPAAQPQADSLAESQDDSAPGHLTRRDSCCQARASGLSQRSTDHLAGPKIKRLEQLGGQGPEPQCRLKVSCCPIVYCIPYRVYIVYIYPTFWEICTYDIVFEVRHRIIPM